MKYRRTILYVPILIYYYRAFFDVGLFENIYLNYKLIHCNYIFSIRPITKKKKNA